MGVDAVAQADGLKPLGLVCPRRAVRMLPYPVVATISLPWHSLLRPLIMLLLACVDAPCGSRRIRSVGIESTGAVMCAAGLAAGPDELRGTRGNQANALGAHCDKRPLSPLARRSLAVIAP